MSQPYTNIAGLSLSGGRRDNFFICLLEYFDDKDRWFLRSLHQVGEDGTDPDGNEAIRNWINQFGLKQLVLDFPLTLPACSTCELLCPGHEHCPVDSIKAVRTKIQELLADDANKMSENPKKYEQEREADNLIKFQEDIFNKPTTDHLLSKGFKRRLKKGFLPYWNRPIDVWIWLHYYDPLMKLFDFSYDSFGRSSQMLLYRFSYLRRHFPLHLELFEGNYYLTLLELFRSKVISQGDILNLNDLELGPEARLNIIKNIEKKLNIFIYDHDLEIIVKNTRAFASFILAVVGQRILLEKMAPLPDWSLGKEAHFSIPIFN